MNSFERTEERQEIKLKKLANLSIILANNRKYKTMEKRETAAANEQANYVQASKKQDCPRLRFSIVTNNLRFLFTFFHRLTRQLECRERKNRLRIRFTGNTEQTYDQHRRRCKCTLKPAHWTCFSRSRRLHFLPNRFFCLSPADGDTRPFHSEKCS